MYLYALTFKSGNESQKVILQAPNTQEAQRIASTWLEEHGQNEMKFTNVQPIQGVIAAGSDAAAIRFEVIPVEQSATA